MTIGIARRKYLADALHENLPRLERALFDEGKGRHAGIFLQRALVKHADETTLALIVDDMKREILALERKARASGVQELAVERRERPVDR